MTKKRDYYEVLSISRTATYEEIKQSYRSLARKYHPDVNKDPDADSHFKEINEAYEVLSDGDKRKVYDRFGHEGLNGGPGPGAGFGGAGMGGFGDIFDMFFGGNVGRSGGGSVAERGDDLRHDVEITLEEASSGVEQAIKYTCMENCDLCSGSGAQPGTKIETCPNCRGTGYVRHTQNTLLGTFQTTTTCARCRGAGRAIGTPCTQCNGAGRMRKTRERTIKLPPGVDSGSRIRLSGEGDAGMRGGENGDLYVVIYVKPHDIFERRDKDIYCEVPISFVRAALGGQVVVPTIGGQEKITLPEGTQSGTSFRLKEKGLPDLNGRGRGDEYVIVRVQVPTKLAQDQKLVLQQFAASMGEPVELPEEKGFLGRLFGGEK